jgi:uncharacterized protein (TIGR03435 family)
MRFAMLAASLVLVTAATSNLLSQVQVPAPPPAAVEPTFEVVSIKPSTAVVGPGFSSGLVQLPDGGFTVTNLPVGTLISRAYPPAVPIDIVGLPAWAMSERYDVRATSSLSNPTADQRTAMLRAMLADRFKLAVHFENREQPVYDLVLARRDGRLGPGLKPVDIDCAARIAADRAAAEAALNAGAPPPASQRPDLSAPPAPCTMRTVGAFMRDRTGDRQGRLGDLMEGETTMDNLAITLRFTAGRFVVNKTGLSGTYRVAMNFDLMAALRGPQVAASTTDDAPPLFTAIQEQLGLKLESSRAPRDTLIIDRLERPTEN